jgi:hypothetical protein
MSAAETGVAGYIAAWRPVSVTAEAACFARQVVTAAGPHGRERAKNLLWAAGWRAGRPASGWSRRRRCCCTRR